MEVGLGWRKNIFFHDGTPFNSKAMAFSIRRFMRIGTLSYILGGRIALNQAVLRNDNSVVGQIRSLRSGEDVLKEATQGDEVAIAISNVTVGRQISEGDVLYIEMDERAILTVREAGVKLDPIEEDIISEMQKIKRKDQPFWGR